MQEKSVKNSEISERIFQVIEYLTTTPNKFATKLGYDRGQTIYDILNGKSAPSFEFFHRFYLSEYSGIINPTWLLTGNGEMVIVNEPTGGGVAKSIKPPGICEMCREKDDRIKVLNKLVSTMQQNMDLLNARIKDLEGKDSGQKRKAS